MAAMAAFIVSSLGGYAQERTGVPAVHRPQARCFARCKRLAPAAGRGKKKGPALKPGLNHQGGGGGDNLPLGRDRTADPLDVARSTTIGAKPSTATLTYGGTLRETSNSTDV
jgi:hypothetical protein